MKKIHLIGNAHLDPVWLWRWQEGYSEVLATFRSALDRIKEFDDFIFTSAAAIYYEWVEETDSLMFEEIKQRVKEGKWIIVGGWLIQPDCNFPCGESFARHSLYGQGYFEEKFGVTAKVGYNVDSFGHSATLPQILKKSGMDSYVYMRPNEFEKEYDFKKNTFMWVSPDGTEIKTYRIPEPYCSLLTESAEIKAMRDGDLAQLQDEDLMSFYGVGNHGGGPTIKSILKLKELMAENKGKYKFSSPNEFFDSVNTEDLPRYSGDLFHHASGCYSAIMKIKALNRQSEAALLNAEKAGFMAVASGVKKTAENLKEAWKPTLFNQFHDIMCGCCIKEAAEDAFNSYGSSITSASLSENKSLQAIAWNIDTSKQQPVILEKGDIRLWERENAGTPFIVFNMNSFKVTAPVRVKALVKSAEDNEGNPVKLQNVRAGRTNNFGTGADKLDSEFLATVEPFGWKLYWIYKDKEPSVLSEKRYLATENLLENDSVRVTVSKDGYIESIFDKKSNKEILKEKIVPIIIDDSENDTWAHGKFTFDKVIGKFENAVIQSVKQGEIKQEIRIKYTYGESQLIMDLILYNDLDEVYLNFNVNWNEKHKIFKISIPTDINASYETVSEPYGFANRSGDGKEHPMHKWIKLNGENYNVGVITDTRSAYDFQNGELRITALRSPIFADHFGQDYRDAYCEYTDQGEQNFKLAICPNKSIEYVHKLSEVMLSPLPTILGTYHKGKLSGDDSLVNVTAPNVVITAFKVAEDGNGYIIHCHEIEGKEADTEIEIKNLGVNIKAHFTPQEIKAFRIANGTATEINLLEKEV